MGGLQGLGFRGLGFKQGEGDVVSRMMMGVSRVTRRILGVTKPTYSVPLTLHVWDPSK